MTYIEKHKLNSNANIRPCCICWRDKRLIVPVEIRCQNMKLRPLPGQRQYIRCTNGICKDHDTDLTIDGHHYEHICPFCFIEKFR